jgi:hypothetical protein
MVVALVALLALWADSADATKLQFPKNGTVQLSLEDSPRSSEPPTLEIAVRSIKDVEDASVTLTITDLATDGIDSVIVWSGRAVARESFTVSHPTNQFPAGSYKVALHLDLSAKWDHIYGDVFYVEVDEDGWLVTRQPPSARLKMAIVAELKARGLHGLSSGKLRVAAPDLARQLDSLGVWISPTKEEMAESRRVADIRRANMRAADSARKANGIPDEVKPQSPDSVDDDRSYPYYEIIDGDSIVHTGKHTGVRYPKNADSLLQEKRRKKALMRESKVRVSQGYTVENAAPKPPRVQPAESERQPLIREPQPGPMLELRREAHQRADERERNRKDEDDASDKELPDQEEPGAP